MRLGAAARTKIIMHARVQAPTECCGVLLGNGDDVIDAFPARNAADAPTSRYLLDPQDHFNAIRDARQRGVAVIGFYHSHPGSPAEPSPTDRAEAHFPGYVYLIVSLLADPPDVRAFWVDGTEWRPLIIPA